MLPRPNQNKRGTPIITIISVIIIVVFFVIGGLGYAIYQAFDTATVTIMPQVQTVSTVFNLTAKLGQTNVDSNAGIVPAQVLNSPKSDSKSGTTTGRGGCTILNFPVCEQAVSQNDVDSLDAQIQSSLQSQIEQDLRQQEQTQSLTPIGNIIYTNESSTASPNVGTVSKTVNVTLSLQGSQEYIKTADAREVAKQKLQGKLKPNYTLLDDSVKTSDPVVARGTVQIKIAAGGVGTYKITPSDITNIQKQIRGKSQQEARAFIAQNANLDPNHIVIKVNYGGNLPGDVQQITVTPVDQSNIPFVQLPLVT